MRSVLGKLVAGMTSVALLGSSVVVAAAAQAAPPPMNQASYVFTGDPQDWPIPEGVQSAYITLIGGAGGLDYFSETSGSGGLPAQVQGTLTWPAGTGALDLWVGGVGGNGTASDPGAGGFNGGAVGGTGSSTKRAVLTRG